MPTFVRDTAVMADQGIVLVGWARSQIPAIPAGNRPCAPGIGRGVVLQGLQRELHAWRSIIKSDRDKGFSVKCFGTLNGGSRSGGLRSGGLRPARFIIVRPAEVWASGLSRPFAARKGGHGAQVGIALDAYRPFPDHDE